MRRAREVRVTVNTPKPRGKLSRLAGCPFPAPASPGWRFRRRPATPDVRHLARYEGVLGTSLELQFLAGTPEEGQAAEAAVLAEIDRLESVFSAYRADSELRRWQDTRDIMGAVSPELAEVLAAAEAWRVRTGNTFQPAVEALTRLWREGAERGEVPGNEALGQVIARMRGPLWDVDEVRRTARRRTCLPVTLNAIAKGFIIDAACGTAMRQPGVGAALVNIGGDIRHVGERPVTAPVADPFSPHDNAPPLATVRLRNKGLATSGHYRRGFQIGPRWYSHLLDPQTGHPAGDVVSVSVIADTAETADVLATTFSVMGPDESLRLADSLPGVGVLLVTRERQVCSNALWRKHLL